MAKADFDNNLGFDAHWMNAGTLNVDRNVSFCASICSKEGLLIVSKTLAQREG